MRVEQSSYTNEMQLAGSRKRWMQCSESRLSVGAHSGAMGAATYKMGAGGVNREAKKRGSEGEEGKGGGSQARRSNVQESRRARAVSGARKQGWTMMHMKGQTMQMKQSKSQPKGQPLPSDLALL
jgi:hypothetical protein